MSIREEIVVEKLERMRSSVEKTEKLLEDGDVPPDRIHMAYSTIGNDAFAAGTYELVLKNADAAKEWFSIGSEYTLNGIREKRKQVQEEGKQTWENESLKARDTLYYAILSQDALMISRAAENAREIPKEYVKKYQGNRPWYHTSLALAHFVQGNTKQFRTSLTAIQETATDFDGEMIQRYRGLATTLDAIESENVDNISAGITDILVYHEANSDSDSTKSSDLMCAPAACIFTLALMNELHPDVDRQYVPESLTSEYIEEDLSLNNSIK